jgi:hypothetical protein
MLLIRAKAGPSKSSVKGNTLTIDRPITGNLEEKLPTKGRRLNGKQPAEPNRRRLREKSLPGGGSIPIERVADEIAKLTRDYKKLASEHQELTFQHMYDVQKAEDAKKSVNELANRLVKQAREQHGAEMNELANRLLKNMKEKHHAIIRQHEADLEKSMRCTKRRSPRLTSWHSSLQKLKYMRQQKQGK